MENKGMQAAFSAAAAVFSVYLGILSVPLILLAGAMAVDYITGIAAAYTNHMLSSRRGLKGIFKKLGCMVLVGVALCADYLMYTGLSAMNIDAGSGLWCGMLVCFWLLINELISIIENLIRLDVPVPPFLSGLISRMKDRIEKNGSEK